MEFHLSRSYSLMTTSGYLVVDSWLGLVDAEELELRLFELCSLKVEFTTRSGS